MADQISSITNLFDKYEVHTVAHLSRAVYDATPQGVNVELIAEGDAVKLTTIVEGSDAEWSMRLDFPFDEEDWYGALEAAEQWADEIRADTDDETYTLNEREIDVLRQAVEMFGQTGHYNTYPEEIEHLLLMLESASAATITYTGPEGN